MPVVVMVMMVDGVAVPQGIPEMMAVMQPEHTPDTADHAPDRRSDCATHHRSDRPGRVMAPSSSLFGPSDDSLSMDHGRHGQDYQQKKAPFQTTGQSSLPTLAKRPGAHPNGLKPLSGQRERFRRVHRTVP